MKLKMQKRLASKIFGSGKKRVIFDVDKLNEIKEALTREDVRGLIKDGVIKVKNKKGVSKFRHKKHLKQKRKGRRTGPGSRKGRKKARLSKKERWINKVRIQRVFLKNLKKKKVILPKDYRNTYLKIKGGLFRSKRHLKLFLEEHGLIKK